MTAAHIEQGSDDWFAARSGKVTASRIADVMAKTKSGYAATRRNYMADLIAERLTGTKTEGFTSADMQWGIDQEPQAARAYALIKGVKVEEVGFVDHPSIENCGASPDRLVGEDGLVEIKCPKTATHLDTLAGSSIDRKYLLQMQWQMACTGRKWCDFVSFDPRLPVNMQMHVQRVERDEILIAEIANEVTEFIREMETRLAGLQAKFGKEAA